MSNKVIWVTMISVAIGLFCLIFVGTIYFSSPADNGELKWTNSGGSSGERVDTDTYTEEGNYKYENITDEDVEEALERYERVKPTEDGQVHDDRHPDDKD